jgi:hypothetical protein
MRRQIVTYKECLKTSREQWNSGRCAEMISNTTGLVDSGVQPPREQPKANADYLLSLAAAPTFAIMALLTGAFGDGAADMLCLAAHASPLSGMVPMYLLMSAFHSTPWLKLLCNWRGDVRARQEG